MTEFRIFTREQRRRYDEDGFVFVPGMLTADQIAHYKARARAIALGDRPQAARRRIVKDVRFAKGLAPAPEDPEHALWKIMNPDRFDPVFRDFLQTPRLLDVMQDLVGPDVLAFLLMYIYRPPRLPDASHPFHQDAFYFPFGPHDLCAALWIPLDDVDAETGSLTVMPGSHKLGVQPHAAPEGVANGGCVEIPGADAVAGAVTLDVKAGDAVAFHCRTWHKAGGNATDRHRRVITVHCASAACRMTSDVHLDEFGMTLVRGRLHDGGLQPLKDPPMDIATRSHEADLAARLDARPGT